MFIFLSRISKTLLITGATDGIGFLTSKLILKQGHHVLIHGRNPKKVNICVGQLSKFGMVEGFIADFSNMDAVRLLSRQILYKHNKIDVLINNAGVLKTDKAITKEGFDTRFAVNTIAPFLLTNELLPLVSQQGRVINVASAAQAPVDLDALLGKFSGLSDMEAYAQSKLAMIMFSLAMSKSINEKNTVFVSVNPGSLLGTKMVRQSFGIKGKDADIGAKLLVHLATIESAQSISGKYYDNDIGRYTSPHSDALDDRKCSQLVKALKSIL